MAAEVSALLWKEMKQIPRKRGAIISAFFFPVLMLIIIPTGNYLGTSASQSTIPVGMTLPGLAGGFENPVGLLLPLMAAIGGLVVPSIAATYTIIGERERNTLELLVALPVSIGQIVLAKLLGVVLLALAIAVPVFAVQAAGVLALGIGDVWYVAQILLILLIAVVYSASSALAVSLLAKDFRTANNINGTLMGPAILISVANLMLLPNAVHLLGLALVLLIVSTAIAIGSLRLLTIERLLR